MARVVNTKVKDIQGISAVLGQKIVCAILLGQDTKHPDLRPGRIVGWKVKERGVAVKIKTRGRIVFRYSGEYAVVFEKEVRHARTET